MTEHDPGAFRALLRQGRPDLPVRLEEDEVVALDPAPDAAPAPATDGDEGRLPATGT